MSTESSASVDLPLERLADHLQQQGIEATPVSAELLSGGRSNLSYLVCAEVGGETVRWVLRRPPLGHVLATAHDMRREHRVIAALRPTVVPVPQTVLSCDDPAVLGAPFFVMEYVEGDILGTDEGVLALGHRAREAGVSLVRALGALHSIDPASVGLDDFGRPAGFMSRQVRRWTTQLEASRSRDLPGIDDLARDLADNVPADKDVALIHGDYRLDNCLVRGAEVVSVLDWEMSTLGDPLADVALFAVYSGGFSDVGSNVIHSPAGIGAFPSTTELLDDYVASTGRPLDEFGWYLGFAWFKLAVILEGIHYRSILGLSVRDEFEGVAATVPHAIERGRAALFDNEWPT